MMKKILSLLFALAILCCIPLTAYAHEVPQAREDCTITLTLRYDGNNVHGGTLTAVKVGYVDENDGNYFFSRVGDNLPVEDIESADAASELLDYYKKTKDRYEFDRTTVDVKNGKAKFSELSTGLYLILQEKAAPGYSKLNPFLISVPRLEEGAYQYHVTASVKTELEREPDPTEPTTTEPKDPQLPQTGQLNWPIPVLVVGGLALFAVGWVLCFGKKRENYEK